MTPEKRAAILAMWKDDRPLTEIMFVCHVSPPEEVEQRKMQVQAKWREAERHHAWQHHHPAKIRTYAARGYGLVEVGS
jgi:hypothetical protein